MATAGGQIVGYARTSTSDQQAGLGAQIAELEAAGCTRIFSEQVSGADTARPELQAALDWVRAGDVFVVTKPERLARNVIDLLGIVERLRAKGVTVRVLAMHLDTGNPTSNLILTILAGVGSCPARSLVSLMGKTVQSVPAKGRPARQRCSNRAAAIGASTRSRRTPTLLFAYSQKAWTESRDRSRSDCPILASTQSGFQTRGWCASGRGSLVVVGIAAPDRRPVYGEDGTEIEKASEGLGHLPRLANQTRKTGICGLKLGGPAPSRSMNLFIQNTLRPNSRSILIDRGIRLAGTIRR